MRSCLDRPGSPQPSWIPVQCCQRRPIRR